MRYRELRFASCLMLSCGLLASRPTVADVLCSKELPAEPIQYTFAKCGQNYTQDEQYAFCPLLEAYSDTKQEQAVPIEIAHLRVDPQGGAAQAAVYFPRPGTYMLVLAYTPFLYSTAMAVVENISNAIVVNFQPPSPLESLPMHQTSAAISVLKGSQPAGNVSVSFPSRLLSADPYEDMTHPDLGTLMIDCFSLDPLYAIVEEKSGCFEGPVRLLERGSYISLGPCE